MNLVEDAIRAAEKDTPGRELRAILKKAWGKKYESTEELVFIEPGRIVDSPRWPSSVQQIDQACGGFYGVVVLGGEAGVGKSLLAMASACCAAEKHIKVVYLAGEMTQSQIAQRAYRRLREDVELIWGFELRVHLIHEIATERDLITIVGQAVEDKDERLLVVVDSIDTIAENLVSDDSGSQFEVFRIKNRIANLFISARRLSEGRIGSILISELNTGGRIKGRKLEYLCDLDVRVTHGDMPDHVHLEIKKGREGGRQDYGTFYSDWRRTALVGAR